MGYLEVQSVMVKETAIPAAIIYCVYWAVFRNRDLQRRPGVSWEKKKKKLFVNLYSHFTNSVSTKMTDISLYLPHDNINLLSLRCFCQNIANTVKSVRAHRLYTHKAVLSWPLEGSVEKYVLWTHIFPIVYLFYTSSSLPKVLTHSHFLSLIFFSSSMFPSVSPLTHAVHFGTLIHQYTIVQWLPFSDANYLPKWGCEALCLPAKSFIDRSVS